MSYLQKHRIVVTGSEGFLGRHVMTALRRIAGDELLFGVPHATYDLALASDVQKMYRYFRPDVVIHLAARVGGIGANQAAPGEFLYENLAMGLHLIEYGRLYGLTKFVQVGTVCSYPKHTCTPFREEDLWNGYPEETNAPYGIAKKAILALLQAYRAQYGFPGIYLIPSNLYGPGDDFRETTSHVIPAVIRKVVEAKISGAEEIVLWGTGAPTRDFLYVEDAAKAIAMAAERYDSPEPLNLGTGVETSISDVARMVCDDLDWHGRIVWSPDKPDGQPRRVLDVTRARSALGFTADVPLRDGLTRTLLWYSRTLISSNPRLPSRSS